MDQCRQERSALRYERSPSSFRSSSIRYFIYAWCFSFTIILNMQLQVYSTQNASVRMGYVNAIIIHHLCIPVLAGSLEADYSQSMLVHITRSTWPSDHVGHLLPEADYTHILPNPSLAIHYYLGEQVNMSSSQRPPRLISQMDLPQRIADLVQQLQNHSNGRCTCDECRNAKVALLRAGFSVASAPAAPIITPAIAAPAAQSSPNRAIGLPSATGLVAELQDKKKHATALRAYLSCESYDPLFLLARADL